MFSVLLGSVFSSEKQPSANKWTIWFQVLEKKKKTEIIRQTSKVKNDSRGPADEEAGQM